VIQVPTIPNPAVLSAMQGLQGVQQRVDREAVRIAEPSDAEAGAQGGDDELDSETFVDATIVQPSVYRANARTLRTANDTLGSLLDLYA
jgi:hypothetical protein